MPPETPRHAGDKHRVFVVDDHPLVRESLRNLLNQQIDLAVCGEAEDAPRALSAIQELEPDVAIVDLSLKSGSGMDLIKDLKVHCPKVAIIVLSMHDESLYAERVLRAGARGYVMKRETTKSILSALRRVLGGGVYVSEAFAEVMAERLASGRPIQPGPASIVDQLSDRELEVFRLLGQGKGTSEIASDLHLSLKTIQAYCARIKAKLGLANAQTLMREAVRFEEHSAGTE
jgi:DNA-binding NarL/FixJ family response regulator